MNIHHLELFYYVARHGGITEAVRNIPYGIQQPAVSGHLKALENTLNLKLFERSSTGVHLTTAGQALLPKAQAILAASSEFRNRARDLQGKLTGKARVGTILDPPFIRLGQFMIEIIGAT